MRCGSSGSSGRAISIALVTLLVCTGVDARSRAARAEFQRHYPCPSSEARRGPCPGWEVDHVTPLKCGGIDAPRNMQWLTAEQHKAKTRREAALCRRRPNSASNPQP